MEFWAWRLKWREGKNSPLLFLWDLCTDAQAEALAGPGCWGSLRCQAPHGTPACPAAVVGNGPGPWSGKLWGNWPRMCRLPGGSLKPDSCPFSSLVLEKDRQVRMEWDFWVWSWVSVFLVFLCFAEERSLVSGSSPVPEIVETLNKDRFPFLPTSVLHLC